MGGVGQGGAVNGENEVVGGFAEGFGSDDDDI